MTEHRRGAVRRWMVAVALAGLVHAGTALPAHAAVPSRIRFVAHAAATSKQNRVTSLDVYEFAGIVSSAPLDVVSTNSGHGDTFGSSSPAVPGAGNELAVGALSGDVIRPITVISAGFHNVPQLSAGSALTLRSGAKGLPSIASVAYEGTWSSPMDWVGIVAIFRGA